MPVIRGFYASTSGMAWEQIRSEAIANNVANVNTDGFKRTIPVGREFEAMMLMRVGDGSGRGVTVKDRPPEVGRVAAGAELERLATDETAGALRETGNSLDFALEGPGEFTYQGPQGLGYTRRGAFHRDADGRLATDEGYPVLVGGSPVGRAGEDLAISDDGMVTVNGQAVGRLDLRGATDQTRVHAKYLEASNVSLAQEMTDLITAVRGFQVNQRALQMQDGTLAKAVSELGRI